MLQDVVDTIVEHLATEPIELVVPLSRVDKCFHNSVVRIVLTPWLVYTDTYCDAMCLVAPTRSAKVHVLKEMLFPRDERPAVPWIPVEPGSHRQCTARTAKHRRCSRPWTVSTTRYCRIHDERLMRTTTVRRPSVSPPRSPAP